MGNAVFAFEYGHQLVSLWRHDIGGDARYNSGDSFENSPPWRFGDLVAAIVRKALAYTSAILADPAVQSSSLS